MAFNMAFFVCALPLLTTSLLRAPEGPASLSDPVSFLALFGGLTCVDLGLDFVDAGFVLGGGESSTFSTSMATSSSDAPASGDARFYNKFCVSFNVIAETA